MTSQVRGRKKIWFAAAAAIATLIVYVIWSDDMSRDPQYGPIGFVIGYYVLAVVAAVIDVVGVIGGLRSAVRRNWSAFAVFLVLSVTATAFLLQRQTYVAGDSLVRDRLHGIRFIGNLDECVKNVVLNDYDLQTGGLFGTISFVQVSVTSLRHPPPVAADCRCPRDVELVYYTILGLPYSRALYDGCTGKVVDSRTGVSANIDRMSLGDP